MLIDKEKIARCHWSIFSKQNAFWIEIHLSIFFAVLNSNDQNKLDQKKLRERELTLMFMYTRRLTFKLCLWYWMQTINSMLLQMYDHAKAGFILIKLKRFDANDASIWYEGEMKDRRKRTKIVRTRN